MSLKTRLWVLGTAIVCGALILIGVVGGLLPQLQAAKSTNDLALNAEDLNMLQQVQLAQLQAAKENSGELSTQLTELRKAIPDTAASSAWVAELHLIERESGALVSEFLVVPPLNGDAAGAQPADGEAVAGGPQQIPVTLTVVGTSRKQVAEFVRDVQVGDRFVLAESVEISVDPAKDLVPWKAQLVGKVFAHVQAAPADAAADPAAAPAG